MTILDKDLEGTSMSPEQRAAQEAKIPHSGTSGVELPVREFDKTTLKEADDKGYLKEIPNTVEDLIGGDMVPPSRYDTTESTSEKPKKRNRVYIAIAGGVALAATSLFGAHALSDQSPEQTNPTTSASPNTNPTQESTTPTASGQPETSEQAQENDVVVTPGELASMSPEELQAFATITTEEAPTPQLYSQQFMNIYESWLNAGGTFEEWQPYDDNMPDEYENAMIEKYDTTIMSSLFASGQGLGVSDTRRETLNRHGLDMLIAGDDSNYSADVEVNNDGIELIAQDGANFTVNINFTISDNWTSTSAYEVAGTGQNSDFTHTWQLQVEANDDGNYTIVHAEKL